MRFKLQLFFCFLFLLMFICLFLFVWLFFSKGRNEHFFFANYKQKLTALENDLSIRYQD